MQMINTIFYHQDMDGTFLSPDEYNDDFIDRQAELLESSFYWKKSVGATHIRLGGSYKL